MARIDPAATAQDANHKRKQPKADRFRINRDHHIYFAGAVAGGGVAGMLEGRGVAFTSFATLLRRRWYGMRRAFVRGWESSMKESPEWRTM